MKILFFSPLGTPVYAYNPGAASADPDEKRVDDDCPQEEEEEK
jgi:hypothetical protein